MSSRLLIAGVAVAAAATGIYFATSDTSTPPAPIPTTVVEEDEEDQPVAPRGARSIAERNEADPVAEAPAESPMQMLGISENARLVVVGRVINSLGGPVSGAEVDVSAVLDPRRMFERGNIDPQEIGRNLFGGGRGGRGGRGGMPDFRTMLAPRPIAEGLKTDAQGRFEVEGETLEVGRLQVSVRHPAFAPQVASQSFDLGDEGPEITLEDIQVETGARVVGYVVDDTGTGVAGAEVSIEARGGFGGFGRDRGGRGRGTRGSNPFGGRANANQLVESVVSDATGRFLMPNVPSGDIRLVATARSYTRARGESVEVTAGQEIDAGTLKLGPGAIVRGTVTDIAGQPIAGVRVVGSFSREGARAAQELARAAEGVGAETEGRNRRGLTAQRFGRGGSGDRQETETDENGQYELDQVPASFVRIEFEHEGHVDTEVDPVEPSKTPVIDAILQDLIEVRGRVVGPEGEPVEFYAIAARRVGGPGNDPFGRGRGDRGRPGRGGAPNPTQDQERAAREAEREAEQAREQAVRQQLLGGTGRTPRPAGDPVRHDNGEFALEGLEPGTYVFDIQAKGYASVAVGELELMAGQPVADQTFRIERGITLKGIVVDAREKQPVANARITLRLPDLDGNNDNQRGNPFGFGGRGRGNFRSTIQSVRTDDQGRFELEPQRAGTYGLSVDARDFPGYQDDGMRLSGDGEQDIRIELSNGGRVFGTVTGLAEGQRGRIVLTNADTGTRRTANVDAKTFEYEINGLPDGGYTVVLEERGGRGGNWRSRVGQFVAAQTGDPEVFVNGDAEVRHDIDASAVELPDVTGRILRNGRATEGLSVRLNPESEDVLNAGGSGARRFAGALFSANANAETGEFTVESVPEGEYTLEVRAGGSGGRGGRGGPRLGGGGPVLATQKLLVRKGVANDVFIDVQLGTISLKIVDPDGNPVERVSVEAILEQESLAIELDEWRNQPSFQRLTVRNGELESSNAPVGFFKLRVRTRTYKEQIVDLQVVPGDVATPLEIKLEANEPQPGQGGGGF